LAFKESAVFESNQRAHWGRSLREKGKGPSSAVTRDMFVDIPESMDLSSVSSGMFSLMFHVAPGGAWL
jgi:hypothetical protein